MPNFNAPHIELSGIAPEIALVVTALLLLVVDAFVGDRVPQRLHLPLLATAGLGVATWLALQGSDETELQLAQMVAQDRFAIFVKVALAGFALLSIWLGRDYVQQRADEEAEFHALLLFAVSGMMLMAGAADLIMVFLALETFSLAIYVLIGFRPRSLVSQESAMKYFLLGAFSSAFFLLGIAITYGAVGSTNFYSGPGPEQAPSLAGFLATAPTSEVGLLLLGVAFLIVGLGFKVAAVPFHMWTPDAYQGAPSPVTGFMAAATKLAAFAALLRLLDATLFPLRADWQPLLVGIAVVTMLAGSIFAVMQEDVKRLLAYSSIAHAGFVLTGVIAANDRGVSGALFYLATYGLTVLGAFAVVSVLAGPGEQRVRLAQYKGLFYDSPLLAAALTLFLLSLAGVPITAGFVGKLVVFGAAIEEGFAWVAVVGAIASAIAAFFYLRVMVVMYMQESDAPGPRAKPTWAAAAVIGLTALATLVFGLYWTPLIDLAERAKFLVVGG